jgi:hypothetical protein
VLCVIIASVTLPLSVWTVITQTPGPVTSLRFASYGYSGRGALNAIVWATDKDSGAASGDGVGSDCSGAAARVFTRAFLSGVGAIASSCGGGVCSITRCWPGRRLSCRRRFLTGRLSCCFEMRSSPFLIEVSTRRRACPQILGDLLKWHPERALMERQRVVCHTTARQESRRGDPSRKIFRSVRETSNTS